MTMTENDKIIRLRYKMEEQLNYIMRQKKVMQSYKEKTTEEINRLKHDNKKLIEKLMKIDKPLHFTIKRPQPRKYIRRSLSDCTDTTPKMNKIYIKELEDKVTELSIEKEREKIKCSKLESVTCNLLQKFDETKKNKYTDYMSRNYLCNEYIVG